MIVHPLDGTSPLPGVLPIARMTVRIREEVGPLNHRAE
jgi:hypothetical protein